MADSKITALTNLTAADPVNDMLPIVDVSDTTMAASGTTKRISVNNILGASGTATLASATITGATTVGTTLGVTGVSTFAAGTALLPALTTTGDTNTGIYYPAADTFAVTTGGTERYRVDSSGNVGVGVTPSAWGTGYTAIQNRQTCWFATSARDANFGANVYVDAVGYKYIAAAQSSLYTQYQGAHSWYTAAAGAAANDPITTFASAKMTLDVSGNLLVGRTTLFAQASRLTIESNSQTTSICGIFNDSRTDAASAINIAFYRNGTKVGSVDCTNAATSYVTSSDYRLKDDVQPLSGGLSRVCALKPSIYKWKINGFNGEGFIAHELAEVVPFAVTGEKDAVNKDGTVNPQGVDLSKVVPILVAAIQELTARVQTLEAK